MTQMKIQAALELAVKQMDGLIPTAIISVSTPGVIAIFETEDPHLFVTGMAVTVTGHSSTPVADGSYSVTVVNDTRFSLNDLDTDQPLTLTVGSNGKRLIYTFCGYSVSTC